MTKHYICIFFSCRDLTHNDLVSVEKSSLTKLPKLRQLLLDYNKISYVEEGAFAHLPALQTLYVTIGSLLF